MSSAETCNVPEGLRKETTRPPVCSTKPKENPQAFLKKKNSYGSPCGFVLCKRGLSFSLSELLILFFFYHDFFITQSWCRILLYIILYVQYFSKHRCLHSTLRFQTWMLADFAFSIRNTLMSPSCISCVSSFTRVHFALQRQQVLGKLS